MGFSARDALPRHPAMRPFPGHQACLAMNPYGLAFSRTQLMLCIVMVLLTLTASAAV